MRVVAAIGTDNIAKVYIAKNKDGKLIEFVESIQPPLPIEKKWVIIVSTLFGCPVSCKFCDAGGSYSGKLTEDEILFQIIYPIRNRFNSLKVDSEKFKIQFARMGEPALNENVLKVLKRLPELIEAKGLIPSISTVAPISCNNFFENLLKIKKNLYSKNFQLQFSIHSTDEEYRNFLIPIKKWDFDKISKYGERFYDPEGRKITLNFAATGDTPIDSYIISKYFDPEKFLIKITPVNPTYKAIENEIYDEIVNDNDGLSLNKEAITFFNNLKNEFKKYNFETIISIGELEENKIGSNCGQFINNYKKNKINKNFILQNAYTYNTYTYETYY